MIGYIVGKRVPATSSRPTAKVEVEEVLVLGSMSIVYMDFGSIYFNYM